MEGGAWWATVNGVTKSWTWLSDFTYLNMGKERVNQVQEAQSPRQDKPEEEHTKTQSDQADKS